MTAVFVSILPVICTALLGRIWGIMALTAALPIGTNAAALIAALRGQPSNPAELGIAAGAVAVIIHFLLFFTLCGFVLKKNA